jgi:tripartite-type tricarboxylate transporter receptor subunit TctC
MRAATSPASFLSALLLPVALCVPPAHGQNWQPAKPVRLIVGYVPGGAADVVSRLMAERLSAVFGQQVVADNRPGATGTIAYEMLAKSAPDGYTLATVGDTATILPFIYRKLTWDPRTSFAPVSLMTTQPLVLAVHVSVPAATAQEFIALARAKPGYYVFGSSGTGNSQHLAGELIKKAAGINMTHVPYKGGGQAIVDLVGGQIPVAVLGSSAVIPYHRAGKVRILAVTAKKRSVALPEVSTLAEAGIPGIDVFQWLSLAAPARTPPNIVARLNAEVLKILTAPATRDKLQAAGFEPAPSSPQELAAMYRDGMTRWGPLVKELKLELD